MGYVLPMDQHVVVSNLHGDDGREEGQDSQVMAEGISVGEKKHTMEVKTDRIEIHSHIMQKQGETESLRIVIPPVGGNPNEPKTDCFNIKAKERAVG